MPAPTPANFPPTGFDDSQSDFPNSIDPFATAVAVLLGAGQPAQVKLTSLLTDLAGEFDSSRKDELAVFDYTDDALTGRTYVSEPIRPALNFMSALALAWFFSKTQADAGNPLPQNLGFPTPPPPGTNFPAAKIPKDVIEQSKGFPTAQQVIPLNALPPLPSPLPDDGIDLFSAEAPRKPANAPPPLSNVNWIFSEKRTHYGNLGGLWGDHGTDIINAGKTLTGPCIILGVKLILVNKHGAPLGGVATSVSLGRDTVGPSPTAVDHTWGGIFSAGAQILSIGTSPTDETVTVHWFYRPFRA